MSYHAIIMYNIRVSSGVAKGGPGGAWALPNAIQALPLKTACHTGILMILDKLIINELLLCLMSPTSFPETILKQCTF